MSAAIAAGMTVRVAHMIGAVIVGLAVATGGAPKAGGATPESALLDRINEYRAQRGLERLQADGRLDAIAAAQARALVSATTRPDDSSDLDRRLREAGYAYREAAEQTALGYRHPDAVVESWMNDAETREALLGPAMREAGVGRAVPAAAATANGTRHVWVLTLAAPTMPAATGWQEAVLGHVNRFRAQHGLRPVTQDERLHRAAQAHAEDMARRDYVSHVAPGGVTLADRVSAAGYPFRAVYENLAAGQPDAAEVVAGWIGSPPHREALLAEDAVHAGVGYAFGPESRRKTGFFHYWTLNLGRPAASP